MTKLSFRIDFEGMTKHIRDLWAEGNIEKAFGTLDACGVSPDLGKLVIKGKAQLAQDPNGVEGVDGLIVGDNWEPDLRRCHLGKYPDPNNLEPYYKELREREIEELYAEVEQLKGLIRSWNFALRRGRFHILEDIKWSFRHISEKAYEIVGFDKEEVVNTNYFEIEEPFSEDDLALEKMNTVKDNLHEDIEVVTDPDLNGGYGLISPEGKFYPCKYMQHDMLAEAMGYKQDHLHDDGWISITKSLFGGTTVFSGSYRKIPQKALDTLFDWADKHREMSALEKFLDMVQD